MNSFPVFSILFSGIRHKEKHSYKDKSVSTAGYPSSAKLRERANHIDCFDELKRLLDEYIRMNIDRDISIRYNTLNV